MKNSLSLMIYSLDFFGADHVYHFSACLASNSHEPVIPCLCNSFLIFKVIIALFAFPFLCGNFMALGIYQVTYGNCKFCQSVCSSWFC